jgi:hypothetical protein
MYQMHFNGYEGLTHYLTLSHFESLVRTRCLYLRRQDLQEKDLADGMFPSANKIKMHPRDLALMHSLGETEEAARDLASNYQSGNSYTRERHYLHCWTLRADESKWMWETHGQSGAGVCIKTSVRRLCEAIGGDRFKGHHGGDFDLKLQPVIYSDEGDPYPTWPSFEIAFRKVRVPGHVAEAEARLLACDYKFDNPVGPDGQLVPVNLDRLFHAIYLGSRISSAEFVRVEAMTNEATGSRVVRPSEVIFPLEKPAEVGPTNGSA